MPFSLRSGLPGLLGLLVLLAALFLVSLRQDKARQEAEGWRIHTVEVIAQAQRLLAALLDAETGQRGYLLTQNPAYLDMNEQAHKTLDDLTGELLRLTSDNPSQQENLTRFHALAHERLDILEDVVGLEQVGRRSDALALISSGTGRDAMERARQQIDVIIAEEERLLRERSARADEAALRSRWLTYAAGVLGLLLLGVAARFGLAMARAEERANSSEALRASDEFNRRVLAASPDCVKLMTLDARLEFFSEGGLCAMEIDDFDRQLKGADWLSFWKPDDRPKVRAAIDDALAGGIGRFQAFCPTAKGTPKWWDVSVSPILDAEGAPEKLLSASRDITGARRSEERIALLGEAAARLLTSGNPAAMVADIFGLIAGPLRLDVFLNYRLTGEGDLLLVAQNGLDEATLRDVSRIRLGQTICGTVASDRQPRHLADALVSEEPLSVYLKPIGITDYTCTPLVVDDNLLGTLAFGRRSDERFSQEDLTLLHTICHYVALAIERIRTEERLRSFNAELEARVAERTAELEAAASHLRAEMVEREAAQAQLHEMRKLDTMGQLTGGVAHDFNNLLTPIVGSLERAQKKLDGDERTLRLIRGGLEAAERACVLVTRLLAFARRSHLEARPVDVGALLHGMTELIQRSIGPQITVSVQVEDGLPAAKVDSNQLELALLNLALNARDAMPGGGRLTMSAQGEQVGANHPTGLAPGRYVRLSVVDTGGGMDQETLSRAVEPFFSTKGIGKGTGLGLSMVHGMAAQSGGTLALSSSLGLGTRAEIWLPETDEAPVVAPLLPRELAPAPFAARILLVDDEAVVRAGTAEMLRDLGYDVTEANGGSQAMALMRSGFEPDVLVTDFLMPGMNGVDLVESLRQIRPSLPALLVTGYADLAPSASGGLPRLPKPFRMADLAGAVAGILSGGNVVSFMRRTQEHRE
ncbi:CHASE3 domain-containing protein [Rubellimicrobium rubrum]|nr:CHASE3 domain-containing protein [Rubellimicrobium rubrum]